MPTVIGVRFKDTGRTYFFNPCDFQIQSGDSVIVETARGLEYGDVIVGPREVEESQVVAPLKNVVRVATEKDKQRLADNKIKQKEAHKICEEKIEHHKLPMKLIDVEYTFDRKKILFYFTSDGRVDFRELVKDLASTFKTRIELRQIGVRDEAKMLGGLGSCGREVCCKGFLHDFRPVTIKMAKDQSISLNPTKISGLCGRLMCCLEYEHEFYKEARKQLRKPHSNVMTPSGPGTVIDNLMLQEKCKVKVIMPGDNFEVITFKYEELKDISDENMEAEISKIKAMPANAFSINNPYETWDDTTLESKTNKNSNRNRNNRNKNNRNRNNKNRNKNNRNNNKNSQNDNKSNNQSKGSNSNQNNRNKNKPQNRNNKNNRNTNPQNKSDNNKQNNNAQNRNNNRNNQNRSNNKNNQTGSAQNRNNKNNQTGNAQNRNNKNNQTGNAQNNNKNNQSRNNNNNQNKNRNNRPNKNNGQNSNSGNKNNNNSNSAPVFYRGKAKYNSNGDSGNNKQK